MSTNEMVMSKMYNVYSLPDQQTKNNLLSVCLLVGYPFQKLQGINEYM